VLRKPLPGQFGLRAWARSVTPVCLASNWKVVIIGMFRSHTRQHACGAWACRCQSQLFADGFPAVLCTAATAALAAWSVR
jgi:hypothetical protein